jgi:hypothetical protein
LAPNGRNTDTVILICAHPRINLNGAGKFNSVFPPDLDAAFFYLTLVMLDGWEAKTIPNNLYTFSLFISVQHESEAALIIAPKWNLLGPVRWYLLWFLFAMISTVRGWLGKPLREAVDEFIEQEVAKRQ